MLRPSRVLAGCRRHRPLLARCTGSGRTSWTGGAHCEGQPGPGFTARRVVPDPVAVGDGCCLGIARSKQQVAFGAADVWGVQPAHKLVGIPYPEMQTCLGDWSPERNAPVYIFGTACGARRLRLSSGPRIGEPGDHSVARTCIAQPPAEAVISRGEPG